MESSIPRPNRIEVVFMFDIRDREMFDYIQKKEEIDGERNGGLPRATG